MINKPEDKSDDALAARLVSADPDEELTVILEITQQSDADSYDQNMPIENAALDEAERARVIDQLETAAAEMNRSVIDSLANFGLKPRGGRYGPLVVVTGSPDAVRKALALDAVSGATLDEPLDLIAPEVPEDENQP